MITRVIKCTLLSLGFAVGLATTAQAGVLTDFISGLPAGVGVFDFRDGVYTDCDGSGSCTNVEPDASGRTVQITSAVGGSLFRADAIDGFGIRGGENDEIDGDEVLEVEILGGWIPTNIGIADLFGAPDGGADGEEVVVTGLLDEAVVYSLTLSLTDAISALGDPNGEVIFGLPIELIDTLLFSATGEFSDDYALALIAGIANPIPEPASITILGAGLLLVSAYRRRRRART